MPPDNKMSEGRGGGERERGIIPHEWFCSTWMHTKWGLRQSLLNHLWAHFISRRTGNRHFRALPLQKWACCGVCKLPEVHQIDDIWLGKLCKQHRLLQLVKGLVPCDLWGPQATDQFSAGISHPAKPVQKIAKEKQSFLHISRKEREAIAKLCQRCWKHLQPWEKWKKDLYVQLQ